MKRRVIWTADQRTRLIEVMARILISENLNPDRYPFPRVMEDAQRELKYVEQGIHRGFFANKEVQEMRAQIRALVNFERNHQNSKLEPLFSKFKVIDKRFDDPKKPGPVTITRPERVKSASEIRLDEATGFKGADEIRRAVSTEIRSNESLELDISTPEVVPAATPVELQLNQNTGEVKRTAGEDDPLALFTQFIEAASKLGGLLLNERRAREQQDLKIISQNELIKQQAAQLEHLKRSLEIIEDFVTSPVEKSAAESPSIKIDQPAPSTIQKKLSRVHVIGMETRNHAFFKTKYQGKLDLHFHIGDSDRMRLIPSPDDKVLIMVDFCGHTIYHKFVDELKRRGLKNNIKVLNGGMSTLGTELEAIAA